MFNHQTMYPIGVPPIELLPWTDIIHAYVSYKLSTLSGDENVWLRTSMLDTWTMPREWTRGLCWSEERVNDTMSQIVNSSVLEARERSLVELETSGHASETCLNPELKDAIKEEQRSSMR